LINKVRLYKRQLEILRDESNPLLVTGSGGGKSHALRHGALLHAAENPGSTSIILHPNDQELHKEHIEGKTGLMSKLVELARRGSADVRPEYNEAHLKNGSSIHWVGADKISSAKRLANLQNIDFAAIDDANRIPRDLFDSVASKSEYSSPRGRIILASPSVSGWLKDYFSDCIIETRPDDLPEHLRNIKTVPSFSEFMDSLGVAFLMPGSPFREAPHVKLLMDVLQRWSDGEFLRLMILMPTQMGKTLLAARCCAAYCAYRYMSETVGIASYNDQKATERNHTVMGFYTRAGGALVEGMATQKYWKTPYDGGSWAAGFGGGQSGNPLSRGIVDDPDKDMKESRSQAHINRKDDWYSYVWLGREAKYTGKSLSQLWAATRFWRHDTVGRTLDYHIEMEEPWHICALPALYDPAVGDYYNRLGDGLFTVEPDFRTELNAPLNPNDDKHGFEYYTKTRRAFPTVFASRDQQMPEESDGGIVFSEDWPVDLAKDPGFRFQRLREYYRRLLRAWDISHTPGGGDWTAGVSIGESLREGRVIIRHATRARLGPRNVLRLIAGTMLLDGPEVDIVIPKDPSAGAHQLERIVEYLRKVARDMRLTCACYSKERAHQKKLVSPAMSPYGMPKILTRTMSDGADPSCGTCDGTGTISFPIPKIFIAETRQGIDGRFRDFAERAMPISDGVEGNLDYVADTWAPSIEDAFPYFQQIVENCQDQDTKSELSEIRALMRQFTSGKDQDMMWRTWQPTLFHEAHLYPDGNHDDLCAAIAYSWDFMSQGTSVYPES
jgi:hypothetical protein